MKVWKGVALTLICFMFVVVAFNLFHKPTPSGSDSAADEQTQAYYAALDETKRRAEEQSKINMEFLQRANVNLEKSVQVTELSLRNQEKFESCSIDGKS